MEKAASLLITLILLGLGNGLCYGQNSNSIPPLERSLTVSFSNNSIKEALISLEENGMFTFAYKTDIINNNQRLTRTYTEKTTREILDDIFQGSISYRAKGNYIILNLNSKLKTNEILIEGYVVNAFTSEKVKYATIYDTLTLNAAITDEYGHYSLKVNSNSTVPLMIKKTGYLDTVNSISGNEAKIVNFQIFPIKLDNTVDSIAQNKSIMDKFSQLKFFPISEERKAAILNFADPLKDKVQLSILPYVGTNGALSASTSVDYSFNLLGGINQDVRISEIGGLFNMNIGSVKYIQIAGIYNAVGGNQTGVQFAGIANLNRAAVKGVQFAGITNITKGSILGGQIAGISNVSLSTFKGIQIAGLLNSLADSSKGFQLSGFSNISKEYLEGGQLSGFVNYSHKGLKGIQLAGFSNNSKETIEGIQIAGFINTAKKVKGVQLSFININDTIEGLPIGFFSFSRKGLHQLEISTNEILPLQIAFKTGTHHFYNSFILASRFSNGGKTVFAGGYGIGSSVKLNEKNRLFFDAQGMQLMKDSFDDWNFLGKGTISLQHQFGKNFSIAAGPSFNVYTVDSSLSPKGKEMMNLAPYSFYNTSYPSEGNVKMWVGGHIALRFF